MMTKLNDSTSPLTTGWLLIESTLVTAALSVLLSLSHHTHHPQTPTAPQSSDVDSELVIVRRRRGTLSYSLLVQFSEFELNAETPTSVQYQAEEQARGLPYTLPTALVTAAS